MNKSQRSSAPTDPSNQHAPPSHILGWCTAGAFSVFHQYWLYFMIWSTKLWHLNPSWATTISTKLIVKPKRWNHLFFLHFPRQVLSFIRFQLFFPLTWILTVLLKFFQIISRFFDAAFRRLYILYAFVPIFWNHICFLALWCIPSEFLSKKIYWCTHILWTYYHFSSIIYF